MNTTFDFQDPAWFWALLLIPLIVLLRRWKRVPVMVVPFAAEWQRSKAVLPHTPWPALAAYAGAICLIVALARPQMVEHKREQKQQGYDIVLALDLSGSMRAEDYIVAGKQINRLQALKPVLEAFINRRPNDRIGIVVFTGLAYTLAPLTFDHEWLRQQTGRLQIGLIDEGKTAIGDGLGVALARLEQGRRETGIAREGAFAILLTDGSNNAGALDPRESAKIAAERKVPVYTIGAGREGDVPMPVFDEKGNKVGYRRMRSDLDESLLRDIAEKTGGRFFRADDATTIRDAFDTIDRSKKIEFEAQSYRVTDELFALCALPGLVLIAIAVFGAALRQQEEALA
jgi:Ca-activated chloride channel family protein